MKITRIDGYRHVGAKAHRGAAIGFRYLLTGSPGQPDNYALMLVDIPGAYSTPAHRHNFEQVRIMLKGSFGFGPGLEQSEGTVGYFPEGIHYQQDGRHESTTLLLQCGGPSGMGYMSDAQLDEGIRQLSREGNFADGVYSWLDEGGKLHHQDGYEAVWERVFGAPVQYPRPRYLSPVILEPERFGWVEDPLQDGLATRHLGTFHERGLRIEQIQVRAGKACTLAASVPRISLLYCMEGQGQINGMPYETGTAIERAAADRLSLLPQVDSSFYVLHLPAFRAARGGSDAAVS